MQPNREENGEEEKGQPTKKRKREKTEEDKEEEEEYEAEVQQNIKDAKAHEGMKENSEQKGEDEEKKSDLVEGIKDSFIAVNGEVAMADTDDATRDQKRLKFTLQKPKTQKISTATTEQ